MKKVFYFILFLVILFFVWQFFDFVFYEEEKLDFPSEEERMKEVQEEVSLHNFNPTLTESLEDFLLSLPELVWQTQENSSHLCIFQNLEVGNNLFPLSLWVYCQEYLILEDGKIEKLSGASLPVLVDYPNELSFYDLEKMTYEIPKDGADYGPSIKEIFSENVWERIFSHNQEIEKLVNEFNKRVSEQNLPR